MKKIILSVLIGICFLSGLHALEEISIYGRVIDYAWAHGSEDIAILFVDPNDSYVIFILDAEEGMVKERYFLPGNVDFNTFDWTAGDEGFFLAGPKFGEFPAGSFFRFLRADHTFTEVYEGIERGKEFIDKIAVEADTKRWAATYSGEGRPDVYFYKDDELITNTEVYPGIITLVAWDDGYAYCMSDVRLDKGFSEDERERSFINSEDSRKGNAFYDSTYYVDERLRLYRIDPESEEASESERYYKEFLNTSFNGEYTVEFSQITLPDLGLVQTTVTIY